MPKYFWKWALVFVLRQNQKYFHSEYRSSQDAVAMEIEIAGNKSFIVVLKSCSTCTVSPAHESHVALQLKTINLGPSPSYYCLLSPWLPAQYLQIFAGKVPQRVHIVPQSHRSINSSINSNSAKHWYLLCALHVPDNV